jgi:gamma-glutamyltranspeptidase
MLTGANITHGDLEGYRVREYDALVMPLKSGEVIHTLRPPSSGALLGFMLRVLEGLWYLCDMFSKLPCKVQTDVWTIQLSFQPRLTSVFTPVRLVKTDLRND